LSEIKWYLSIIPSWWYHRIFAKQWLYIGNDSSFLLLVLEIVFTVIDDDIGCHVGLLADSFVLFYFALADIHILLDIWDDYSFGIHITNRSFFYITHNNIDVVNSILWTHSFFYNHIHKFVIDLGELPLGWCQLFILFCF
jgi:hypothetical protein